MGLIPFSHIAHNLLELIYLDNDSVSPLPTVYRVKYKFEKDPSRKAPSFDFLQLFNMWGDNKFNRGQFLNLEIQKGEGKAQQGLRGRASTCAPWSVVKTELVCAAGDAKYTVYH